MSKEEILERLFQCKTEEDFVEIDNEIMKIKESGDTETAQALWQQLFMIEEGVGRDKLNQNKDEKDPNAIYGWETFPLEKNFDWNKQNKDGYGRIFKNKEELENEIHNLISDAERDFEYIDNEDEEYGVDNSHLEINNAYSEGMVYAYKQILKLIDE